MKHLLCLGVALLLVSVRLPAAVIAAWNFNSLISDSDPTTGTTEPSQGWGTASLAGSVNGTFVTGDTRSDPAGSSDNSGWRTTSYPSATEPDDLTAGVWFDVDTTGYDHIVVSWCQQNSASASRYLWFGYTLDGITYDEAAVIVMDTDGAFTNLTVDLSGIPEVANNPYFGFCLLAEFESTATGTGSAAYVATKTGSNYSPQGSIRFDMVTISGTPGSEGNTPPYIFGPIPSQSLRPGQSSAPLPFTVLDAESPAAGLTLAAASSNPGVLPVSNLTFGGSGAERTVTVQAGSQPGTAAVTIWVSDPDGSSNSLAFAVTVLPSNLPPALSAIARTNTLVNLPTPPIPFTIGDAETAAASLTLSARSGNPALVPNGNIGFGGSGSNRTVTVTPAPGQTGVAPITITVSDGSNATSAAFPVMVTPSAAVVFEEPFTYADGSLLTNSAFLWTHRSGTLVDCQVSNQQVQVTATCSEDVSGGLLGAPYNAGSHTVLYAAFKARFLTLPKAAPGLFAHFGDGSTWRGRVYAGSSNSPAGEFQLFVSNGAGACTPLPVNLHTNTAYTVVTRYDIDNALTTLWVNPTSEAAPGVTATDVPTASHISYYGLRESDDIGAVIQLDDLRVALSFAAVTATSSNPAGLTIERNGANLVLRWSEPTLLLQAAPSPSGPFTNVPGAASPFSQPASGPAKFFRLRTN